MQIHVKWNFIDSGACNWKEEEEEEMRENVDKV